MPETAPTDSPSARASARTRKLLACSPTSCFSFDMEILSFGIDLAPQDKKVPRLRGRPSDQSPAARLPRHDREHFSTIVNTAHAWRPSVHDPVERCSRCRGIRVHHPAETLFTIAWNTHDCGGHGAAHPLFLGKQPARAVLHYGRGPRPRSSTPTILPAS